MIPADLLPFAHAFLWLPLYQVPRRGGARTGHLELERVLDIPSHQLCIPYNIRPLATHACTTRRYNGMCKSTRDRTALTITMVSPLPSREWASRMTPLSWVSMPRPLSPMTCWLRAPCASGHGRCGSRQRACLRAKCCRFCRVRQRQRLGSRTGRTFPTASP